MHSKPLDFPLTLWYNGYMNDRSLSHQGSKPPTEHEANLYSVFCRIASGATIKDAVESVNGFSLRSFFTWRERYSDWFGEIQQRATRDVQERRRRAELALLNKALEVELQVQGTVLDRAVDVAQRQIEIAVGEKSLDKDKIAASRFLRTMLLEGFAVERSGDEIEGDDSLAGLAYDPHETDLTEATITLPPGSRVTVETPDLIEGKLDNPTED